MLTHVARRHMAGVDRGIPRGERCQKGRLRLLQMKGDLVIAVRRDLFQVPVPGFAGIDAQLFTRLAADQVPSALNVLGRERLAVVPLDALLRGPLLVPRPASREIGHDRSEAVLLHCWSNMTRLLNTPIIGPWAKTVASSKIDMLAGLSGLYILSMPPCFWAKTVQADIATSNALAIAAARS